MHDALARLAKVARAKELFDDERYALSQLVMIAPHELNYTERLREINQQFGYDEAYTNEDLFDSQFNRPAKSATPELETFEPIADNAPSIAVGIDADFGDFAIVGATLAPPAAEPEKELTAAEPDQQRLLREVDSVRFYIDS